VRKLTMARLQLKPGALSIREVAPVCEAFEIFRKAAPFTNESVRCVPVDHSQL
jgi:hypothetical protein